MSRVFIPSVKDEGSVTLNYLQDNYIEDDTIYGLLALKADVGGSTETFTHPVSIIDASQHSTLTLGSATSGYGAQISLIADAVADNDAGIEFVSESTAKFDVQYDASLDTLRIVESATGVGVSLDTSGDATFSGDLNVIPTTGDANVNITSIDGSVNMTLLATNDSTSGSVTLNLNSDGPDGDNIIFFKSDGSAQYQINNNAGNDTLHIGPDSGRGLRVGASGTVTIESAAGQTNILEIKADGPNDLNYIYFKDDVGSTQFQMANLTTANGGNGSLFLGAGSDGITMDDSGNVSMSQNLDVIGTASFDQTVTIGAADSGSATLLKFTGDGSVKDTDLKFYNDGDYHFSLSHFTGGSKFFLVTRKVGAVGVNKGLYCELETGNIVITGAKLQVDALLTADEIDATTATDLLIGKTTCTTVSIGTVGIDTNVVGDLVAKELLTVEGKILVNEIDTESIGTLLLGNDIATKVEIGDSGTVTQVLGSLVVDEGITGDIVHVRGGDDGTAGTSTNDDLALGSATCGIVKVTAYASVSTKYDIATTACVTDRSIVQVQIADTNSGIHVTAISGDGTFQLWVEEHDGGGTQTLDVSFVVISTAVESVTDTWYAA